MNDQAGDLALKAPQEPASAILRSGRRLTQAMWTLFPLFVLLSAFGQSDERSDNVTHEIANLKHSDFNIRASAARTLGAMNDPRAVAPLVLALKDDYTAVRSAAIESLAMLKDPRALDALIPLSRDENREIRGGAILALGEFRDQRAVVALIAALNNSNESDQELPASSLGRIGVLAVDPLVVQRQSRDPAVRARAVDALGWIEVPRAFDALIPELKDTSSSVRHAAVAAIYGHRDAPGMLLTPFDPSGLFRLLVDRNPREARDPRVIDLLIAALQDPDRTVRLTAAGKLGELETPRAVAPLLVLLNTPAARQVANAEVRIGAIEALGRIDDPRALQPLVLALKDPDARVREQAAAGLVNRHDPAAAEPLIASLSDANEGVRVNAAQVLGKIKAPRSVEPLIAALHDPGSRVAEAAANALGEIGDARGLPALVAALKELRNPFQDGHAVLLALEAFGPPAVDALAAASRNPNPDVRVQALSALGGIAGEDALAPLVAGFHDQDNRVRAAAAGALAGSRNPGAAQPVLAALKDSVAEVRESAVRGLCVNDSTWAIDPLVAALRDPDSGFVEQCLNANPDGIRRPITDPFLTLLKDPDGRTRRLAAEALSRQVMTHTVLRNLREPADGRVIAALLALLKAGDTDGLAGAYMFFVALGEPGSEGALAEALRRHGDEETAGYVLTCGNAKLEEAARAWFAGQRRRIEGFLIGPTWGSARRWLLSSPAR
jgi:HEAT repeat protein